MTLGKLVGRILAATVTIVGVMVSLAAIPTSSPRDRASVWAKSLSAADRHAYAGEHLAGLPVEYRKAVFAALKTTDERIAFWQNVFSTYRQTHALTDAQQATLSRAEAIIPVIFRASAAQRPAQEAALEKLSAEVRSVLGSAAQQELFHMAGPDFRRESLPVAERVGIDFGRWSHTNVVARAANRVVPSLNASDCGCNASQNDCYYSQTCGGGLNGCSQTGGCACTFLFFDCWTCDGQCYYPLAQG
jgi:hypothetical protein